MSTSIIVGTFGSPDWAQLARERALPSARAQSVPALDVIHVHAQTLAEARNEGAGQAEGDLLIFLDADDELSPNYVEAMEAADGDLRQPATDYGDGPSLLPPCDLRNGNYLVIGTAVRSEVFCRAGCFKDEPIYEDWSLWLRCHRFGASVVQVPDAVYRVHTRPHSRNESTEHSKGHWQQIISRRYG